MISNWVLQCACVWALSVVTVSNLIQWWFCDSFSDLNWLCENIWSVIYLVWVGSASEGCYIKFWFIDWSQIDSALFSVLDWVGLSVCEVLLFRKLEKMSKKMKKKKTNDSDEESDCKFIQFFTCWSVVKIQSAFLIYHISALYVPRLGNFFYSAINAPMSDHMLFEVFHW